MGLKIKSLSEDNADAYTHIWSFVFFLFLAFLLLVVPGRHNSESLPAYEYKAACWCPAQFTGAHVAFTNAVCSAAVNALKQEKTYEAAGVYKISKDDIIPGPDKIRNDLKPSNNNSTEEDGDDDADKDGPTESVKLNTPVFLFALAVALRLPRMLCAILSGCCNCINVGQTLESAKRGETMVPDSGRRQMYAGLVSVFTGSTRSGKKTSTFLYLLMKTLMIIVIVAEIIVVRYHILPELEEKTLSKDTEREVTSADIQSGPIYPVFLCDFKIRQMTVVQHFTVQCHFRKQQTQTNRPLEISDSMLSTVFTIVLVNLVVLMAVNVLSTLMWLLRLVKHDGLGLDKTAPLDLVFLIQMARTNLSAGVAAGLAQATASGSKDFVAEEESLQKL